MKKTVLFKWLFVAQLLICIPMGMLGRNENSDARTPDKPMALWIDASANFRRLATRDSIHYYLDKAQQAGFNAIIVNVKPVTGEVLYNKTKLPRCRTLRDFTVKRKWDYLQYFIKEARHRGMRVSASPDIMTMGYPFKHQGPAYTDPYWDDKLCTEYLPTGLHDIRNSTDPTVFAFLNPVLPEVHDYVMQLVSELAKYDIDGLVLDYCRWMGINSDFSEASRQAFEKYAGVTVEYFPQDILTYNSANKYDYSPGPHYNKWLEWRSMVVHNYIKDIRNQVKGINPKIDIEYWAGSWWPLIATGQNWASPKQAHIADGEWWATPDFYKTGFADLLDIFQLGAYLPKVRGDGDLATMEGAMKRARQLLNGDCRMYGTFMCDKKDFDITDAIYYFLSHADGVMVFDLCYVVQFDFWDKIRQGVDHYLQSPEQ